MRKRKMFRWYGGKIRVTDKINMLMPEHEEYYEPFMGSASVLLNHPRSKKEVINDLDTELVHFVKTLADGKDGKELMKQLGNLRYEESVFNHAMVSKKTHFNNMSKVEKAVEIYILITQSFNATRKNFSRNAYRNTNVYRAYIKNNIPLVHERLQGVEILNEDGIEVLARIADNPKAFAFVDPPYCHELRGKGANKVYACEMAYIEQVRLLRTIRNAKCKIMLCGYRSEKGSNLYDMYLLKHGWKCYKLASLVKSCQSQKGHKDIGIEYIWVNYELPKRAKYIISMKEYSSL